MISKHVPSGSFYHTCRYACNRLEAEILVTEGVRGHDYKLMAGDFLIQQQMRPSKEKACFHGILSFYPGEKPSDEMMVEIAEKYLNKLGITNTQYSVIKHTDKAHLHLHIVANMVNNDGKSISDSYLGLRGKKVAQKLTEEYKLIPAIKKNLDLTHLEKLSETEANRYKIYIAIAENLSHCRNLQELEFRLLKLGIDVQYKYKGQTSEKQGVSFKIGNYCYKGSQVDRKFSLAGLEKSIVHQQKEDLINNGQDEKIEVAADPKQVLHKIIKQKNKLSGKSHQNLYAEDSSNTTKGLEKALADLLKPEEANEDLPYELTHKGYLNRKKKQNQKHKM
jgi:hypothetical protein